MEDANGKGDASQADFVLADYLANGVEDIVRSAVRATLKNPRESAFMARYAMSSKAAEKRRADAEARGDHVPPFLIASITSSCNLYCAGCYARENASCADGPALDQLTDAEWAKVFEEARDLGIGFILLAGGEPLMRPDVLRAAAGYPEILFPVFTNGTMIDDAYLGLFDKHRNLVPVFSVEGDGATTDARRGAGVYDRLVRSMGAMAEIGAVFGVSVTVTRDNLDEAVSDGFVKDLERRGCKLVVFVEFVPVDEGSAHLAPGDADRERLAAGIARLRACHSEMLFISFPGDEQASGGCLAAGRGFFHINSHGGAEPCPFSPYSDVNVRDSSLADAMRSRLFTSLRDSGELTEEHEGGCVLFEKRERVGALVGA